MDSREYIHSDPSVMSGRPVVRGTRLTVEFLVGLLASGWTHEQVLDSYPQLSHDALRAVEAARTADASRFLSDPELDSIRQRSHLTEEDAAALADEIDHAVWERFRHRVDEG